MSFLTSLGNLAGGYAQGMQTATQNREQQHEFAQNLALQQQQQAYQQQLAQAQLAQQGQQLSEQQKIDAAQLRIQGIDPNTGLPMPFNVPKPLSQIIPGNKGHGTPTADDYVQHYLSLAAEAVRQGRPDLAQQYNNIASQWGLGAERSASAQYTKQGRLPLAQAQAGWWKQRHQEVEDALKEKFNQADAATRARMTAARISAGARLQSAQIGADQRAYIETLTALNAANRQDSTQAFNEAMRQYTAANAQWQAQSKIYDATGQAPPGFNPQQPPTPQQFTINVPQATPQVMMVPIQLPDGTVRQAPVVRPGTPPRTSPAPAGLPPIQQVVDTARKHNVGPYMLREKLQAAGYPQAEIDKVVPKPATSGGGFGG